MEGEGGGVLTITIPGMTERAPSARVKLQCISEAFRREVVRGDGINARRLSHALAILKTSILSTQNRCGGAFDQLRR